MIRGEKKENRVTPKGRKKTKRNIIVTNKNKNSNRKETTSLRNLPMKSIKKMKTLNDS